MVGSKKVVLTSSMYNIIKIAEPLGLECLAAVLRKNRIETVIVEPCIKGLSIEKTADLILEEKSNFVGISLHRDKDISDVIQLIKLIKKKNDKIFFAIGGHGASVGLFTNPNIYKELGELANCFMLGEGEITILGLVNAIYENKDWKEVQGIAFLKENNFFVFNKTTKKINDLDSLPFMERDVLKQFVKIYGNNIPASIVMSRGCAYNKCKFCTVVTYESIQEGPCYRQRSVKNIVQEIENIHNQFGITEFNFEDDNFILPGEIGKKRVTELCQRVSKLDFKISFTFFCRIDCVDYDLFSQLKNIGLKGLYIGIESIDDDALQFFNKGICSKDIYEGLDKLIKLGFSTSIESDKRIMLGYICWHPLTTIKELKNTSEFLKKYSLTHKILRRSLHLYSGSKIIEDIKERGLLDSSIKVGWKYKEECIKEIEIKVCNFIYNVDYERDRIRTIEKWQVRFNNQTNDSEYFKTLRLAIDDLCFEYFDTAVEIAEEGKQDLLNKLEILDCKMNEKYNNIIDLNAKIKIEEALRILNIPVDAVDLFRK